MSEPPPGDDARPLTAEEVVELMKLWAEARRSPTPEYANAMLVKAFLCPR